MRRKIEFLAFKAFESARLGYLKDLHKGKRCFLIGNGPSLKKHDLLKLKGEETFVSNMFVLHDQAREIDPSFYCISDWIHWTRAGEFTASLRRGFRDLESCTFFFEYDAKRKVKKTSELADRRVYYLFQESPDKTVWEGHFTQDIADRLIWGRTVMIDFCIPLACYMGFKDVYLIGNDYNWNLQGSESFQKAYFYKIENDDRRLHESSAHQNTGMPEHIALIMKAYELVREEVERFGIKIYNAGYGGKLEVFPRVNYEDLF